MGFLGRRHLMAALILVPCSCGSQTRTAATRPLGTGDCAPDAGAGASQVIRDMYAALTADDASAPGRLFAADFYAFDGGVRFTGPELFALIKNAHATGKTFVWDVVAPEVHLACDVAWVTWENRGSVAEATNVKAVTWLESAVLRWAGGAWRISFFHSTRVPPPKNPTPAQ